VLVNLVVTFLVKFVVFNVAPTNVISSTTIARGSAGENPLSVGSEEPRRFPDLTAATGL